jgi:very-short-patch-repair endonuclease
MQMHSAVDGALQALNVEIIREFRSPDLRYQKPLSIDFYLPLYDLFIEVDGSQHFKGWNDMGSLEKITIRDRLKNDWVAERGSSLVRMGFKHKDIVEEILAGLFERSDHVSVMKKLKVFFIERGNKIVDEEYYSFHGLEIV